MRAQKQVEFFQFTVGERGRPIRLQRNLSHRQVPKSRAYGPTDAPTCAAHGRSTRCGNASAMLRWPESNRCASRDCGEKRLAGSPTMKNARRPLRRNGSCREDRETTFGAGLRDTEVSIESAR